MIERFGLDFMTYNLESVPELYKTGFLNRFLICKMRSKEKKIITIASTKVYVTAIFQ